MMQTAGTSATLFAKASLVQQAWLKLPEKQKIKKEFIRPPIVVSSSQLKSTQETLILASLTLFKLNKNWTLKMIWIVPIQLVIGDFQRWAVGVQLQHP